MEYPGDKKQHFQHLLFFAFYRGQKAAEAAQDICMVYREGFIGKSMAREWFAKFKNGNFDIDNTLAVEVFLNLTKTISKHF